METIHNFHILADKYNVFIFDLWGVLHNGKEPFLKTLECLAYLKQKNKAVFLLSNSPRLAEPTAQRLTKMGISPDLYQGVYTSGVDCHMSLRERPDSFYQGLGQKLYHIGPDSYVPIFATLNYTPVSMVSQADFILVSGTVDWVKSLAEYLPLLQEALATNQPLICANRDKQVMYGQERVLCAGMIAESYQKMGGQIRLHGKPDPFMYQQVHQLAEHALDRTLTRQEILMIGDSLTTDIKGANFYGIDSVMVLTGIHGDDLLPHWHDPLLLNKHLTSLTHTYQTTPTYVMAHL